jgi:hypothetical protein
MICKNQHVKGDSNDLNKVSISRITIGLKNSDKIYIRKLQQFNLFYKQPKIASTLAT